MVILAQQDPTYQPATRIIIALTKGYPAQVTTSFAHDYLSGTIVRLVIPPGYGMTQANKKIGTITVTGNDTFTIDLDTTSYDAFTIPLYFPEDFQHPQVIPIGSTNDNLKIATRNVLGG